jgi:hypothetical protein
VELSALGMSRKIGLHPQDNFSPAPDALLPFRAYIKSKKDISMTLPALSKPQLICNPFAFLLRPPPRSVRGLQACSQDLGYEISEDELARELRACAAGQLVDQAILEIDPDEFVTAYQWFLS